jgi:hypothetical protein
MIVAYSPHTLRGKPLGVFAAGPFRQGDRKEYWPVIGDDRKYVAQLLDENGLESNKHPTFYTPEDCLAFLASLAGPPQTPEEREAVLKEAGWE